jgi:SAM-dependent methyltransferase
MRTLDIVKDYYSRVLKSSQDLKTSACCSTELLAPSIRSIAAQVHPEVVAKYYGCGSPIPPLLTGTTVLDLGSGSGRDCFILSKLVGPKGLVIGIDMTDSQLAVARRHVNYHTELFGYERPNVEFRFGYIEDLHSLDIQDDSVDVVVSNCVINLSPDKERVFSEIFRVLKPGGEMYFSDVFASRRLPLDLVENPVLVGECLGGAQYVEDFRRLLAQLKCFDYRVVAQSKIQLSDPEIERKVGMINFYSNTVRAFKLSLEDRCEDYGQVATYLGSIPEWPHHFDLDDHHHFITGKPMLVCGNTAQMLIATRYAPHFKVVGNADSHYGIFDCRRDGISLSGPAVADSAVCC